MDVRGERRDQDWAGCAGRDARVGQRRFWGKAAGYLDHYHAHGVICMNSTSSRRSPGGQEVGTGSWPPLPAEVRHGRARRASPAWARQVGWSVVHGGVGPWPRSSRLDTIIEIRQPCFNIYIICPKRREVHGGVKHAHRAGVSRCSRHRRARGGAPSTNPSSFRKHAEYNTVKYILYICTG